MSFRFDKCGTAGITPKNKKWNYKPFNFKIWLQQGESPTPVPTSFIGVNSAVDGDIDAYKIYTTVAHSDGNLNFTFTNYTPTYTDGNLKI